MKYEYYLNLVDSHSQSMALPLIDYIDKQNAEFDEEYSKKTMIPTWRKNGGMVGIGCRKTT